MLIFQVSKPAQSATVQSGKKNANPAKQQDGNLFISTQKSEAKLIQFKDFTPEMHHTYNAAKKSAEKLEKVIYGRTIYMLENADENLNGGQYLGPNLDDCYFHRQWMGGIQDMMQSTYSAATLVEEARNNAGVFLLSWHLDYMRKWAPVWPSTIQMSHDDVASAFASKDAMRAFASGLERKNGKVIVSNEEMQLEFMANGNARMDAGAKNTANFVLKHYPPVPGTDATHASRVSFPGLSLSELDSHYARAFDYFLSENKASSVMMAHTVFPGIEQEMAIKHPEIKSIIPSGVPIPACLSPNIIRGHLRKDLGYEGMVLPDSFGMTGFRALLGDIFKQVKGSLPPGGSDAVAVLAIYAGLNEFPLGDPDFENFSKPNAERVKQYYDSNNDFKKLFDDLLREKLFFKEKFFCQKEKSFQVELTGETLSYSHPQFSPNPEMAEMHLSDLYSERKNLTPEKARIIGEIDRQISDMSFAQKIEALRERFCQSSDLRNRGNNFALQLRKGIIEDLYGLKLPDYPISTDERSAKDPLSLDERQRKKPSADEISRMEKDWQESLFANKDFSKAYYSINWNSLEMRSIFAVLEKEAQNPMLRKATKK